MSYALHAGLFASGLAIGIGSAALLHRQQPQAVPAQSSGPGAPTTVGAKGLQSAVVDAGWGVGGALDDRSRAIIGPGGNPGPVSDLLSHAAYVSSYDRRLRHPAWTAEHLTAAALQRPPPTPPPADGTPAPHRPDRSYSVFKEDVRLPLEFRARLADYFRSGYDRGHMVPAADAKQSQLAMDETFLLSNIAPQVGEGFNRDYWAHTEDFVRRLTARFADLYVFTIPLYLPRQTPDGKWNVSYEVIGNPPNIAVPTHFAKVILGVGLPAVPVRGGLNPLPSTLPASSGTPTLSAPSAAPGTSLAAPGLNLAQLPPHTGLTAFVMPNAPIPNNVPLRAFEVPVETVERAAGLSLFGEPVKRQSKRLCDLVACDIIVRDFSDRNKAQAQAQAQQGRK